MAEKVFCVKITLELRSELLDVSDSLLLSTQLLKFG